MKLSLYCLGVSLLIVQAISTQEQNVKKSFFSQASQDAFVFMILYNLTHKTDPGYYLEIGAAHPISLNNTYFFEKNYQWTGVSLEISSAHVNRWSQRKNTLLIEDATKADYVSILRPFPSVIDYLSLDIDNLYDIVLERIPLDNYIFKVITIGHDFYRFGNEYREKERAILSAHGYYLLCPDVTYPGCGSFEDWWIHPIAFEPSDFLKLTSLNLKNKNHQEIITMLEAFSSQN